MAGYSQAQLARKTGYARSTVSTVESGSQNATRIFWERSDAALGTGTALRARYDRLAQRRLAGLSRTAASDGAREQARRAGRTLDTDTVAEAVAAYLRLGWRARDGDGRIELVCGNGVEALEVPRPAGVVAVHWWLHTGGAPDEIRGLPALPGPQDALAVISAGDRYLFLVQAGACPWAGRDIAVAALADGSPGHGPPEGGPPGHSLWEGGSPGHGPRESGSPGHRPRESGRPEGSPPEDSLPEGAVRWHADGSRILAPPSLDDYGQRVAWAYPPPGRLRLANPIVLLDLLAKATALTRHRRHLLTFPGGISVLPAASASDACESRHLRRSSAHPAGPSRGDGQMSGTRR